MIVAGIVPKTEQSLHRSGEAELECPCEPVIEVLSTEKQIDVVVHQPLSDGEPIPQSALDQVLAEIREHHHIHHDDDRVSVPRKALRDLIDFAEDKRSTLEEVAGSSDMDKRSKAELDGLVDALVVDEVVDK